MDIHFIKY